MSGLSAGPLGEPVRAAAGVGIGIGVEAVNGAHAAVAGGPGTDADESYGPYEP